jgi:acyl carrier protein
VIENEIIEFIAEQCQKSVSSITPASRLEELGIDSMQAIVLLYDLEERYNIEIPTEVFESIDCVGDIISKLEHIIRGPGTSS